MWEWRYGSIILDLDTEMEVSDQLQAQAALPLGDGAYSTHWTGSWVGPRSGLGSVKRNILTLPGTQSQLKVTIS
jgi:hypothetical protein